MGEYQCANCFDSFNLLRQLVEHRIKRHPPTPKPATTEPPELPPLGETFLLGGRPYVVTGVVQFEPGAPEEIIDRVTDAICDFTARRKAKRENGIAAFDNSGPYWACEHCGLLVKANDAAYSAHESACDARIIARAMSTPLPHDPDIRTRLMPWRGKE